jgi:hypothetical protein
MEIIQGSLHSCGGGPSVHGESMTGGRKECSATKSAALPW